MKPAREVNWYDLPHYYDIAFQEDTQAEAEFVVAACERYARGPVRRLLEPGCGSGRLIRTLAKRGYDMIGLDLSSAALQYCAQRLHQENLSAILMQADLRDFNLSNGPADSAFCFCNTFRHLLTEAEAQQHLQAMARAVRPGGLYILGLHLFPPDADLYDSETWTESADDLTVTVHLRVQKAIPEREQEILRVRLAVHYQDANRPDQATTAEQYLTYMTLRTYTVASFLRLLEAQTDWQLQAVYDFNYDLDEPRELDEEISDTVLILMRS